MKINKTAKILFDVQLGGDTRNTASAAAGATLEIPQRLALEFARQFTGQSASKPLCDRFRNKITFAVNRGRLADWTVTICYPSGRTRVVRS